MPTGVYPRTPKPLADPAPRFWARVNKTETCWLWTGDIWPDGYGRFWLAGKNVRTHRVVYEWTYGAFPADLLVCHHCDEPLCVRPDHLFLGTTTDNIRDASKKGRMKNNWPVFRGAANCRARFTDDQVREIREAYQPGQAGEASPTSLRGLARRYGVSKFAIQAIVRRQTWKHLD